MAVMVWCNDCKKVVWAYDHQKPVDLRGICNLLKLPCPQCSKIGNFDGWESDNLEKVKGAFPPETLQKKIYDWWSAMKVIAEQYGVEWAPSGNNQWFPEELGDQIKNLIQWERR